MAEYGSTSLYDNLPDNSHKARAEAKQRQELEPTQKRDADGKRAEKIVKGEVKVKKNELRKFKESFFSEDLANIKDYILMDVIAPAIKNTIYEVITNGLGMALFGGRAAKRSTADKISYSNGYTNYNNPSRRNDRSYSEPKQSGRIHYDEVLIPSQKEAKDVLSTMEDMIDTYGAVRIADFYDLLGITGEYTDNDYGWKNLRNATIDPVIDRDGIRYRINFPRAIPVKRN